MSIEEFSAQFDVLYNNITSNSAPGLNEYEKSIFLTKAQDEIVKNYFSSHSKGNNLQEGFDDSLKRQSDFMSVLKTANCGKLDTQNITHINPHSFLYSLPEDSYIIVNEVITTKEGKQLQVLPLRYEEYTRLMSKPFKRPLKNQAWKLANTTMNIEGEDSISHQLKIVEIIVNNGDDIENYTVRYVKKLLPIILVSLEDTGLKINGRTEPTECELDSSLHQNILQRAVELAKASWITSSGNDNVSIMTQLGQRSE